jgi:hypothetical protein
MREVTKEEQELFDAFDQESENCSELFARKQMDYGPFNISNFGLIGVIIRMNDKFERLKNLVFSGKEPQNESILDTLRDVSIYAKIAVLVEQGKWPYAKRFKLELLDDDK